jgi:hypothetical protein
LDVLVATSYQVEEFLDVLRQAGTDSETFQNARRALLASDKAEVLALFETRLQGADEEGRAGAIQGLALLYGQEAIDTILRWVNDPSPTVRFVACICLQDYDESRVVAALLERLKCDADCQIRGVAAYVLGQLGAMEALPELHHTCQTDLEYDELGHSPSGQAEDAITSVLREWVLRQIQGTPAQTFRGSTRRGTLRSTVTAESIPCDAQGRLDHTFEIPCVPHPAFGPGCAFKKDLQTSLIAPFEIDVEYADPTCVIRRIFIYQQISDSENFNWAVVTVLDPDAVKSPRQP